MRNMTREAGIKYGYREVELVGPDGMPPPRCGDIFIGLCDGGVRNDSVENLDEFYQVNMTLTMRVKGIPLDRIGDQLLAKKVAQKIGFNARCDVLRALFNKNWQVVQRANQMLVELNPDAATIYGFCEPPIFVGREAAHWVGPDWFSVEPSQDHYGLAAQLRFDRCRRLQAVGSQV
jgi:hypothetical protein